MTRNSIGRRFAARNWRFGVNGGATPAPMVPLPPRRDWR
jgi:hypothetical protein